MLDCLDPKTVVESLEASKYGSKLERKPIEKVTKIQHAYKLIIIYWAWHEPEFWTSIHICISLSKFVDISKPLFSCHKNFHLNTRKFPA